MTRLSLERLRALLLAVNHAMPLNITAMVDARARKTNNPFYSVAKLSVVNGFTGFDYETSVNRQRTREDSTPDFAAQARAWGTVVSPALVENKGEYYLRLKVERTKKPVYLTRKTEVSPWLITPKSKVEAFLPAPSTAVNQGLEKEVVYRNYKLSNLVSLSMGGEQYRIRH
jgi:hypothetical protein